MERRGDAPEHKNAAKSKLRLWMKSIFFLIIFIAILFITAGRLDWMAGWAFLVFFLLAVGVIVVWARRHDPELMKERQAASQAENVKRWDQIIMVLYTILLLLMLVLAALDAGRLGWSDIPLIFRALGWLGLCAAFVIVWRVMAENTYLSEMVRIQEERGHQVVTTGPYQYVRHPMYVGVIIAVVSIPLALGSLWALVPGVLIVILFIIRTALEDRTLMEELPGYKDYAEQVRFRLVPGIW
jgi:protein-S-isoprenylcysteine O-methyltransferase Ste14